MEIVGFGVQMTVLTTVPAQLASLIETSNEVTLQQYVHFQATW